MSELLLPSRRRPPTIVPPLLSFTAGFIDSFTVLALFGLFVAQVTGSFVLTAAAAIRHEQDVLTKVLAIPIFLVAGMMTTVMAVTLERRGRAPLSWVLGFECAVLTAFFLVVLIGAPLSDPDAISVAAASLLGLFAMGTQSATVRLLMQHGVERRVMPHLPRPTMRHAVALARFSRSWSASSRGRLSAPWRTSRPVCVGSAASARDHVRHFRLGEREGGGAGSGVRDSAPLSPSVTQRQYCRRRRS